MKKILHLPRSESYKDHAIQRSSGSIISEPAASTSQLQKHFDWKSKTTSLKYINSNKSRKRTVSNMLTGSSKESINNAPESKKEKKDSLTVINLLTVKMLLSLCKFYDCFFCVFLFTSILCTVFVIARNFVSFSSMHHKVALHDS